VSWQGNDGYRHTIVFGVGILKEQVLKSNATAISKVGIVGLAIRSDRPNAGITLGFSNSLTVQIPAGWQGVINVLVGKPVGKLPPERSVYRERSSDK
jgi:hypothetical protein